MWDALRRHHEAVEDRPILSLFDDPSRAHTLLQDPAVAGAKPRSALSGRAPRATIPPAFSCC